MTLTYECPSGHGNRVSRVYYEENWKAAEAKASKTLNFLRCYSLLSHPQSRNAWENVEAKCELIMNLTESQFRNLEVGLGEDFSHKAIP